MEGYRDALAAVRRAEAQFNAAEPAYIDAACYALTAAQARLRAILRDQRKDQPAKPEEGASMSSRPSDEYRINAEILKHLTSKTQKPVFAGTWDAENYAFSPDGQHAHIFPKTWLHIDPAQLPNGMQAPFPLCDAEAGVELTLGDGYQVRHGTAYRSLYGPHGEHWAYINAKHLAEFPRAFRFVQLHHRTCAVLIYETLPNGNGERLAGYILPAIVRKRP